MALTMRGGVQLDLWGCYGALSSLPCPTCGSQETRVNAADEWHCRACGHDFREDGS